MLATACAPDRPAPDRGSLSDADQPVEVTDDAGRAVRLATPARRIVSLVPSATETLVAMGAEELLVGRTDYDDPALAYLPSVGGGLTPSIETILTLHPDLVILWEEADASRTRSRLESLGIPVYAATTIDTTDIFTTIRQLGTLTARAPDADALATRLRDGLEAVRTSVAGLDPPGVLYMISMDPPMVAGPGLFIGELVGVAGGRNVFADVTTPSPQLSLEEIVRRQPDVVIVPKEGTTTVQALVDQPGWRELAADGTRFYALPADTLHRPGPVIVTAAERIRDVIHANVIHARPEPR
ncbi:MAG: helical backbone metal receptor [Gemmatimonadota bacterium]|jgi:iron complex transport system substrate-binding protein|nr:helical backbone metal receptor [Gemmatimonadota bacterium]